MAKGDTVTQSVRVAQERTGKVNAKQLLAAIRAGRSSLYVHAERVEPQDSWTDAFVFTLSSVKRPRTDSKAETTTKLDVPGEAHGGTTSQTKEHTNEGRRWVTYSEAFRPRAGFWSLGGYADERLIDALESLPGHALVSFDVQLDAGTTENHMRATGEMEHGLTWKGLHSDHFFLVAEIVGSKSSKVRRFLIDTACGPHNTARFGSPQHETDAKGRAA